MSQDLKDSLPDYLMEIDLSLAEDGVPLHRRPLDAASIFVLEYIIDIRGGTKNDFLAQPWFASLFKFVQEWYADKYGAALKSSDPADVGLTVIFGTPFKVKIPLTLTERGETPGTVWLCFPNEVLPGEQVVGWVQDPPNLSRLSTEDMSTLVDEIAWVVAAARTLHIQLMTAELAQESTKQLAAAIRAHVTRAIDDICSLEGARMSLAMWDLFFAVEKALKVYLIQKTGTPLRSHDLEKLVRRAESSGLSPVDRCHLHAMPSEEEAMQHRYGEIEAPTVEEAAKTYKSALAILVHCADGLERTFGMRNARLLISQAPWTKGRRPDEE